MSGLTVLFIALGVFGVGVTVVDLFGALGHDSGHQDGHDGGSHGDHSDAHDGSDHDGHDASGDHGAFGDHDGSAHDAHDASGGHGAFGDHDGSAHDAHDASGDHEAYGDHDGSAHDGHDAPGDHNASAHDGHDASGDQGGHAAHDSQDSAHHQHDSERSPVPADRGSRGSLIGAGNRATRTVARAISALRTLVYFSLGAGPMGIIAQARGEGAVASVAWAAASGVVIAAMARIVRRVARRELDSSVHDEDLVGELAEVVVPIEAGRLGKIKFSSYGKETYAYARLESGNAATGAAVRAIDCRNGEYLVVPEESISGALESKNDNG